MTTRQIRPRTKGTGAVLLATALAATAAACTPTIRFAAPSEPITINLNVKIDQEVRVRLDREIEDLIANNPDVF